MTLAEHRAAALRAHWSYKFHRHSALAIEHRAAGRDAMAASHEASARTFAEHLERGTDARLPTWANMASLVP